MSSTSPQVGGDTSGNPAPSPAMIASSVPQPQQQQQIQPQPPQQPLSQPVTASASNSSPTTTTTTAIHNNTNTAPPPQPLFLKPHPTILPTYTTSTTTTTTSSPAATNSSGASPPVSKSPLTTTTPTKLAAATTIVNPHFLKGEGVKEPLPTDVICGRGKMTASHPANRRFRELVDSHKAAYQNSKRRDEKTRITCELVDKLRGEGRFVLFDPNTKLWHEVSEEYAREKVSHSLRSRSSTEQRIAHAASNSMKMLNSALSHDPSSSDNNNNMVNIAPRNPLAAAAVAPSKAKSSSNIASEISSSPTKASTGRVVKTKLGSKKAIIVKKKPKAHKGPSSSTSSSSRKVLKPGLDEIVKRLIQDQQKLLRIMIQKETDRFTSAAAMGASSQQPRQPLSYKAEASAVSKLTASLPKLDDEMMMGNNNNGLVTTNNPTSTMVNAAADKNNSSGDSKKDENQSNMSATVTA